MKYHSIWKSFKFKKKIFEISLSMTNYEAITISYFHHSIPICKDLFSESVGTKYLKKFYVDLWFFRFEIALWTETIDEYVDKNNNRNDGKEIIAITGEDPFRENLK